MVHYAYKVKINTVSLCISIEINYQEYHVEIPVIFA